MAEPTISLAEIRRAICRELKMPFFRRYKNGYLMADTGGSTTTAIDAELTQGDGFGKQSWFYRIASMEAALITRFTAVDNKLTFETPVTTVAASDQYEIHTIWNAYEIHEAINEAIRNCTPDLP